MHMHFGWGKNVRLLCYTGFVALPFPIIFLRFFFHYLFFIMSHLSLGKKEAMSSVWWEEQGWELRVGGKCGAAVRALHTHA